MKVTPETLTDEMVRAFRSQLPAVPEFGGLDWQRVRECEWALIGDAAANKDREARDRRSLARQRFCDAINARRAREDGHAES